MEMITEEIMVDRQMVHSLVASYYELIYELAYHISYLKLGEIDLLVYSASWYKSDSRSKDIFNIINDIADEAIVRIDKLSIHFHKILEILDNKKEVD